MKVWDNLKSHTQKDSTTHTNYSGETLLCLASDSYQYHFFAKDFSSPEVDYPSLTSNIHIYIRPDYFERIRTDSYFRQSKYLKFIIPVHLVASVLVGAALTDWEVVFCDMKYEFLHKTPVMMWYQYEYLSNLWNYQYSINTLACCIRFVLFLLVFLWLRSCLIFLVNIIHKECINLKILMSLSLKYWQCINSPINLGIIYIYIYIIWIDNKYNLQLCKQTCQNKSHSYQATSSTTLTNKTTIKPNNSSMLTTANNRKNKISHKKLTWI